MTMADHPSEHDLDRLEIDGLRFGAGAEPWRPDLADRDELRILTSHIGAHPPVVGAEPHHGRWPAAELGVGVTAWWDPERVRPRRWQHHLCRTIIHDLIEARAPLAPTLLWHHDALWLVRGHHALWLLIAARYGGVLDGPVPVYVHAPGAGERPRPQLECSCPHKPPPPRPRSRLH